MTGGGQGAVGERGVWVGALAWAVRHEYPDPPFDRHRELAEFIAALPQPDQAPRPIRWSAPPTAMAATPWPVTPIPTLDRLARFLGLTGTELAWVADVRGLERKLGDGRLRHYHYRWVPKARSGVRMVEEPKRRLKGFQRMLLADIVSHIPPHAAAHGFRTGHSVLTHATNHL